MAGRLAIPLHDHDGNLIGYAGRMVDDNAVNADTPKYKLPGNRERGGILYEFRKSLFLYNGNAVKEPVNDLIVVEGFPSVWWLWQAGYKNVVGLMGASCSPEQAVLITKLVTPAGRVWIFSDGDDAGERCAVSVLTAVAPHRLVRWTKLSAGRQPTDCQPGELAELLGPPV
ncbi:MAG: toprim domain-containing protein [Planctomycetes bacterium]|nr:toprim domain-containing protein [Planctomycetota bacterium]